MKFRFTALLVAVPAVIAGLLVTIPAEAAGSYAKVTTRQVAMYESGSLLAGKVNVSCASRSTCRGTLKFAAPGGVSRTYAVKGRSSATVTVLMYKSSPDNPYENGTPNGDYKYINNVDLTINESSPSNSSPRTYTDMRLVTRVASQKITGNIVAVGGAAGMSDLRVELVRVVKGGNTELVKSADVSEGGSFDFTVALGTNNAASNPYRLKIRGVDSDGEARSWYYRGGDGTPSGGGRYLIDASPVQATAEGEFNANFRYTSISGSVNTGANTEVTVVAPPPSFSSNVWANREIDYARCGNVFGSAKTDGAGKYKIGFLPATDSLNNRYALKYRSPGGFQRWFGAGGNGPYGSCYDATEYAYSKANLITLDGPLARGEDQLSSTQSNNVTVKTSYSSSYSSKATAADKWISIREAVPGLDVLESPVVAELQTSSGYDNQRLFADLRPGKFWIEVGRQNGCNSWQPSVYSNNTAYFQGADRSAERWKTVAGKWAEYHKSYDMGYKAKTPPSGKKGWMFRNYCKAYGAGAYDTREFHGVGNNYEVNLKSNPKGAVVSGRVTRAGGKTNKEILVRLSSTDGKRITRTDVTDSSGRFYIAGLESGKWTIAVNSDSWRGIGRGFRGKKSISVYKGRSYSAGTLHFTG